MTRRQHTVREGNILKVDCFLNHQMDVKFPKWELEKNSKKDLKMLK